MFMFNIIVHIIRFSYHSDVGAVDQLAKMEETQEKAMKKAAKEAVTAYNAVLSDALTNDTILRSVVKECVSKKIMTSSEMNSLFDPYTNRALSVRASDFVSKMLVTAEVLPGKLDEYLCILHKSGNPVVQDAAKKVAEKCKCKCAEWFCLFLLKIHMVCLCMKKPSQLKTMKRLQYLQQCPA